MKPKTVKFQNSEPVEFFRTVKSRVNSYFEDNNISRFGNAGMKFKTACMFALYFTPFGFLVSGSIHNPWLITLMWLLMGFGMSGIGSKAGGRDSLLQFVEPRAVCENTMRRGFAPGL